MIQFESHVMQLESVGTRIKVVPEGLVVETDWLIHGAEGDENLTRFIF